MKLIDEHGKLLGKINVIDLLAVLLVLGVLAAAAFKLLGNASATNPLNQMTAITYTVRVPNVDATVAENLSQYISAAEGRRDQLMASGRLLGGYICDYRIEPHVNYTWDSAGRATITIEDDPGARVDVYFTIEAQVQNLYVNELGTQEVRIGKTHIVKTVNFEFQYGTILDCVWHGEEGVQ